jgi:hypothetical protein
LIFGGEILEKGIWLKNDIFISKMNYPKVSIIILNWNGLKDTAECLESLKKNTYPNYEIIIVDNGSKNDQGAVLEEKYKGYIKVIKNKDNLGFAGGNNVGIKHAIDAGSEFILVLNNDVIVEKDFLRFLVEDLMKDKTAGIAGPVNYDYYNPQKIISMGRIMNFWSGNAVHIFRPVKNKSELDAIWGCCMLIKKDVFLKIGYFYEPYFLTFEEIDFCVKAKKQGFKIICNPMSKIWHKVSSTMGKVSTCGVYYGYRNKFLFIKRNYPFYFRWLFYLYYSAHVFLIFMKYKIVNNEKMAFAVKTAMADSWQGNFGERGFFIEKE